jgi:hypothetical protein
MRRCDGGSADGLWLWLKPGSIKSIPLAHVSQLKAASNILLFRSNEDGASYYNCDSSRQIFIHTSIPICPTSDSLYQQKLPLEPLINPYTTSTFTDWENLLWIGAMILLPPYAFSKPSFLSLYIKASSILIDVFASNPATNATEKKIKVGRILDPILCKFNRIC